MDADRRGRAVEVTRMRTDPKGSHVIYPKFEAMVAFWPDFCIPRVIEAAEPYYCGMPSQTKPPERAEFTG